MLVVDNAPSDDRTRRLVVRARARSRDLDYVTEPRPGLSWARNRAIEASRQRGHRLGRRRRGVRPLVGGRDRARVRRGPRGRRRHRLGRSRELETQCQAWFEQYSGVRAAGASAARCSRRPPPTSRARCIRCRRMAPAPTWRSAARRSSGSAASIARSGTGTATLAGEDTAALSALLLAGGTIVYQPARSSTTATGVTTTRCERVMLGYGRGLSAYYASMLVRQPWLRARAGAPSRPGRCAISSRATDSGCGDLDGFPHELAAAQPHRVCSRARSCIRAHGCTRAGSAARREELSGDAHPGDGGRCSPITASRRTRRPRSPH